MTILSRSLVVGRLAAAVILLVAALSFAARAEEEVYAITDVMVTDNAKGVPGDYTGLSWERVTLPYIPGQVGERVNGADVNRGIGGTNTSIWVKYQRLPKGSVEPVLVDIEVCHWVGWKVTLPEGPGWKAANGTSAGIQGALTTKTKESVWHNGLAVRYMPLRDAGSQIMALYLSVTSSSTPSQPRFSWPPSVDVAGKAVTVQRAGIDIHHGGGGKYFSVMKYAVGGTPTRDPIADGITVLTYNTHLFGGSSAVTGAAIKEFGEDIEKTFTGKLYKRTDPLVFDDDRRAKLIAERIRGCGADIIALQEV